MNMCQINAMSDVIYQQSMAINELQAQTTLLGTKLQHTQLHLTQVDSLMQAASTIAKVLLSVVANMRLVDCVLLHLRATDAALAKEQEANQAILMLSDLEAINMELSLGDFAPQMIAQESGGKCDHEWNILCDNCFFAAE